MCLLLALSLRFRRKKNRPSSWVHSFIPWPQTLLPSTRGVDESIKLDSGWPRQLEPTKTLCWSGRAESSLTTPPRPPPELPAKGHSPSEHQASQHETPTNASGHVWSQQHESSAAPEHGSSCCSKKALGAGTLGFKYSYTGLSSVKSSCFHVREPAGPA